MFGSSNVLDRRRQRTLAEATPQNASHTTEHTTVALIDASRRLYQDAHTMYAATSDFEDVHRLHAVIESYGMSKAVMALLPDNIHDTLPGMPSMESLDRMPLPRHDPRTDHMLESLSAALEEETSFLKMWVSETSKNVCAQLDLLHTKAMDYKEQAKVLRDMLRNAYVSENILKETMVTCLPVNDQIRIIESMCETASQFDIPQYSATSADLDASRAALDNVFDRITPMTGICFDDKGRVTVDKNKIARKYTVAEENLYLKGYTAEKTAELCDMIITLAGALEALTDKKPGIKARLDAIHDGLSEKAPCEPAEPDYTPDAYAAPAPAPTPEPEPETPTTPEYGDTPAEEALGGGDTSTAAHREMMCAWVGLLGVATEASINIMSSSMMVAERVRQLT